MHYIPIHTHPYYQKLGFQNGDFPNTEAYYTRAISLPLQSVMSIDQQKFIVKKMKDIFYG